MNIGISQVHPDLDTRSQAGRWASRSSTKTMRGRAGSIGPRGGGNTVGEAGWTTALPAA